MKNKEQNCRYEQAMNSLGSMQRAVAPDGMFAKIQARLQYVNQHVRVIPVYKVSLAAASLLLLLALNLYLVSRNDKTGGKPEATIQNVTSYYGLTDNAGW